MVHYVPRHPPAGVGLSRAPSHPEFCIVGIQAHTFAGHDMLTRRPLHLDRGLEASLNRIPSSSNPEVTAKAISTDPSFWVMDGPEPVADLDANSNEVCSMGFRLTSLRLCT